MHSIEIQVPDIGDLDEVAVIELMVKVGDNVRAEQSLITVESDKASMEIPSSAAGVVKEILVALGSNVKQGSVIVRLDAVVASSPAERPSQAVASPEISLAVDATVAPSTPPAPVVAALGQGTPAHNPGMAPISLPHASPSVRKLARELGVALHEVKGSGLKGRITDADVQAYTRSVMNGTRQTMMGAAQAKTSDGGGGAGLDLIPWPKVDFAKFGPIERKDRSRIKKISAANLHRNWVMIPHVTNHDEADITELEAFRVSTNQDSGKGTNGASAKVTLLAFLIKACVAALQKFPDFNASMDGEQLVLKQYFHIGFAADTPNGLVVPVIRDADKKGIFQISQEMSELAKKARDGKLSPAEMTGAGFTISSLGGIGGRYFTPIINAPEVAILGVCRSTMEPVWDGKAFQPRLMLPLSLSWDHRVIDGASAARFNLYLCQILADFRRILL